MEFRTLDVSVNLRDWLISPLAGEMGGNPEGGAVPLRSRDGVRSTLPPSALPGISPAGGEINHVTVLAESSADIPARDALLDRAMGLRWKNKSSEKLRRGRLPAEGLAFVARDAAGGVAGTVRLWDVAFGCEVAGPPPFIPPHKGEGGHPRRALPSGNSVEGAGGALATPTPLWGGVWGGGSLASSRPMTALLLGPLAVDPVAKSAGIGSALMRHAISEAKRLGHGAILLVGDAAYYARFGFSAEKTGNLAMPGPYERHRFLALELFDGALDGASGTLEATGRKAVRVARLRKEKGGRAAAFFMSPEERVRSTG